MTWSIACRVRDGISALHAARCTLQERGARARASHLPGQLPHGTRGLRGGLLARTGLHGEVEGHELHDGPEAGHARTHSHPGEACGGGAELNQKKMGAEEGLAPHSRPGGPAPASVMGVSITRSGPNFWMRPLVTLYALRGEAPRRAQCCGKGGERGQAFHRQGRAGALPLVVTNLLAHDEDLAVTIHFLILPTPPASSVPWKYHCRIQGHMGRIVWVLNHGGVKRVAHSHILRCKRRTGDMEGATCGRGRCRARHRGA
jgi:hypothetical protein